MMEIENKSRLKEKAMVLSFCNDMVQICKPLNYLDIDYLSYTRVYKNGTRFHLSSLPEVIEKYYAQPEEVVKCGNEHHPDVYYAHQILVWSTLPHQEIYQEAKQMGAGHGIYLFNTTEDYTESLGLGTSSKNEMIIATYFNHFAVLKAFMQFFNDQMRDVLKKAESSKIILPFENSPSNYKSDYLNQLSLFNINHFNLTPQQSLCVKLYLKGLPIKKIASEMDLSVRTVETHFNLIKQKLQCRNQQELIIKLMSYQFDFGH